MDIKDIRKQALGILEGDRDNYDGADGARIVLDLCDYIEKRDIEYILVQESGSDWYVIPADKQKDWNEWLMTEAYEMGEMPDWAVYIAGYWDIKFTGYRIE